MPVLKYNDTTPVQVKAGVHRKMIYGHNLMTVIIDFDNGPWAEPDPPHAHHHEQTTYIAHGEIVFICEGEIDETLRAGDMFFVPSNRYHTIQLLSKSARLVDSFNPLRNDFL